MSSRSSRRKEKNGNGTELHKGNGIEGTAARTRPFSFDEIMLRRKNKKVAGDVKDVVEEVPNVGKKDIAGKDFDRFEPEKAYGRIKDGLPGVQEHASEESVRRRSRKKEEKALLKEDKLAKISSKNNHHPDSKRQVKVRDDVCYKLKDDKLWKGVHSKRKKDEWSNDDSDNESRKKHSRDSVCKDRDADRSRRKSESEHNRKHRIGDEERNRDRSDARKVNPRKRDDSDALERKEARESPPPRYEELRIKRKRSRSQERGKNRDRRSNSLSPVLHKSTSYHRRERADLTSHSLKERSGRYQFDYDRSRISGNGSSSHYRRHSGSKSGLGGYSPRKRRSEAAIKTPSPIKRSPEKKSVGWDCPPPGTDSNIPISAPPNAQSSNLTITSSVNQLTSVTSVNLNAAMPPVGLFNSLSLMKGASIDSVQLTQATRPMRRIYVENVPASASEKSLMECLNKFLMSSGTNHIKGTQPCISCMIHKEKGHAFVEFLTPEDASAALSFDGRSFSGSILKIRRPKDFVEVATGVPEKPVVAIDAISDLVMDSPNKIFIGGISNVISSKMIMEIASAFGPLKAFHFQNNEDLNGTCAFLEYVDQSITLKACSALNGLKVGGQVLTVVQALPNASEGELNGDLPYYGIPDHAKPLLQKPTQVLMLKNVFNHEILSSTSGTEVEQILEDIRLECARFGTIVSVNVVKYNHCATANIQLDDKDKLTETFKGGDDSGEVDFVHPEHLNNAEELKEMVEIDEGGNRTNALHNDNLCVKDEQSELGRTASEMVAENPSTPNRSGAASGPNHLDDLVGSHSVAVTCSIKMEDFDLTKEEIVAEANWESEPSLVINGKIDSVEKAVKEQVGNIHEVFEPGSVLVEYKRSEASCMAAHCLHGRLFDNRVVTVSYVALDIYQAWFPR